MMSSLVTACLGLALAGLPGDPPPAFVEADRLVFAAHVHVGDGRVFSPGWVAIKDGKISGLGRLADGAEDAAEGAVARDARTEAEILDLGAAEVAPGLVDGISSDGLARGEEENEQGRERTPSFRISELLEADAASLRARVAEGVTSVVVQPGARNVIGGLVAHAKTVGPDRDALLVRDALGLRITLGSTPARGNRPTRRGSVSMWSRQPVSRMSVVYLVREAFNEALEYRARRRAAPGRAEDPELETYLRAMDGELPVFWHARAEKDILTALRLAEEFGIPRNILLEAHEIEDAAEAVKAAGAKALIGPLYHPQYRQRAVGPRGLPFARTDGTLWPGPATLSENEARALVHLAGHVEDGGHDCLAVGCANLADLEGHPDCVRCFYEDGLCGGCAVRSSTGEDALRFGVEAGMLYDPDAEAREACQGCCGLPSSPVLPDDVAFTALAVDDGLASDLPVALARGRGEEGETLIDFARFATRLGVSPDRALALVTSEPARLLGLDDRVGTLETGKDADLVAFTGAPLDMTSAVLLVMVDGETVHDERAFHGEAKP